MSREADLIIHGGIIGNEHAEVSARLAISGGRIAATGAPDLMPRARATIDASGRHLLPGAIDPHVHFRDPGLEHKEDWGTGTASAACGGVTTVFDMPNTAPPTGTWEALALKQMRASEKAVVGYGIYGLLDGRNLGELEHLATDGVIGCKLFVGNTTGNFGAD